MFRPIHDKFTWSFTKLSAYSACPWSFCLKYCQFPKLDPIGNAWSDFGTLCHELLDGYAKGHFQAQELKDEYVKRYASAVTHEFPPYPRNYAEKTYQQGMNYFDGFTGFGENMEILSSEEKFKIHIGPYPFVGVSDLILRNKDSGEITVVDHKTKSESSMKNEIGVYKKQLQLYAAHCKQKYGQYPAYMSFNMIKGMSDITIPFKEDEHREALQWAEDTADEILMESEWKPHEDSYYCNFICDMRRHCSYYLLGEPPLDET